MRLLYPLAFSLGVMLTLLYYSLDHLANAEQAEDRLWIKGGRGSRSYRLDARAPLALLDAFGAAHGATTDAEIYVVRRPSLLSGGHAAAEADPRRVGVPVYDEAVAAAGPIGWLIALPVVGVCLGSLRRAARRRDVNAEQENKVEVYISGTIVQSQQETLASRFRPLSCLSRWHGSRQA